MVRSLSMKKNRVRKNRCEEGGIVNIVGLEEENGRQDKADAGIFFLVEHTGVSGQAPEREKRSQAIVATLP